jgi:ribosome-associated heat shock protein Hsp15
MSEQLEVNKIRLDKWLWAARFFKTRSLAVEAIESGKVTVNEVRLKPAKGVAIGDILRIRQGQYWFEINVLGLSDRRGPAAQAQKLYCETPEGKQKREAFAAELKALPKPSDLKGRPTKRDRRDIEKFNIGAW